MENEQELLSALMMARQERDAAQAKVAHLEARVSKRVTDPAQAEAYSTPSLAFFRKLIEHSHDSLALIDAQGKIVYSNSTNNVLGYSIAEYASQNINTIIHPDDAGLGLEFLAGLVATPGLTRKAEVRMRHKQGHYVWLEVDATNLLHDPDIGSIVVNSRDITARMTAEKELRDSERRYRRVVEAQTDPICRYDSDFKFTFVNRAYSESHGKQPEDLIGKDILEYVFSEDRALLLDRLKQLSRSVPDTISENRTYLADGTLHWFQWKDSVLLDEDGSIREYQGVGRDITERKALEMEQRHQLQVIETMRQFLQATLDASPNQLAVLDPDGIIVNVNNEWKRFGDVNGATDPMNYLGVNYLAVCRQAAGANADYAVHVSDSIQDIIEGRRDSFTLEYPCHSPTEQHWFRLLVTPFAEPAPRCVVVAHIDITEQIATEQLIKTANDTLEQRVTERTAELARTTQRLEASLTHEREFQSYLMKLHEVMIELTAINELDMFYKRVVELGLDDLGFERMALFLYDAKDGQAIGTYGTDITGELVAEHHLQLSSTDADNIMMRTLRHSRRFTYDEDAVLHNNMIPIGRGWNVASVLWDGHQGLGWLVADNAISHKPASSIQLDILALYSLSVGTLLARKQADVMLAEERNLMRTLIDTVPDLIFVKDREHRTLLSNEARSRALGAQTPEAVTGTTDFDFYPPEIAAKFHAEEDTVLRTGVPLLDHEELVRVSDTELLWVSTNKVPLRNLHGEIIGLAGVARDITERKARERELRFHAGLQEAVMDAVIATDMEFMIQSWNRAAEQLYGWTAEEVIGRFIRDVLKTQFTDSAIADNMREVVVNTGFWVGEVVHHHRDGAVLDILSSVVLLRDNNGQPIGAVEVNHNITERKHADVILQQKFEEEREFQHYLKELHDISMELALIDQLDDFYRFAVEQGLKRLGFERLALFLYEPQQGVALGTFGTGTDGELTDERNLRFVPNPNGVMMRALARSERLCIDETTPLYNNEIIVGAGWNAAAALWNGSRSIGLLVADNFITHKPSSKQGMDILALYALTIGTLLGRKQTEVALRESEASLLSVMNSTSVGIVLVGLDGVIRLANQLAHNYGTWLYRQSIEPGKTSVYDIKFAKPKELEATFAQVFAGQRMTRELTRVLGAQTYAFDVRFDPVVTSAGKIIGATVSIINITAHKEAEEALRQAFEKEKEVGELKSRFVSMASHEFRTPLATILATTETLMNYRARISNEQIDQRFEKIRQQVLHMKDIMEDMLQLSRIEAGRMEFNPIGADLDELCTEIIEEILSSAGNAKRIRYVCTQTPLLAHFDLRLMRQIISNLVTNALKYSPSDTVVRVTLSHRDRHVILSVTDSGIGIPADDMKHLFAPFHRAKNVGTISGTGLGLSIIKQAVELHGGTITVDSQVGNGSTFTVVIPVNNSPRAVPDNAAASPDIASI